MNGDVVLLNIGGSPLDNLGPPPAGLIRVRATRQNTLELQDGEPVLVTTPRTSGGPDVWTWHLLNVGPGICYARWDGLGYAESGGANSIYLPAGVAFSAFTAGVLTLACDGATTVAFTLENLPRRE